MNVTFLDSAGLVAVLAAHRLISAAGRRLEVRNPSRLVYRVFDLSGVNTVVDVRQPQVNSSAD